MEIEDGTLDEYICGTREECERDDNDSVVPDHPVAGRPLTGI